MDKITHKNIDRISLPINNFTTALKSHSSSPNPTTTLINTEILLGNAIP